MVVLVTATRIPVAPPHDDGGAPRHEHDGEASRRELGAFLRSRRERLTPDQVGLPGGGRRRTPGLRREEVAVLAGVGVTWYTWLEQGRDISPSEAVLAAVCDALRLGAAERSHVWLLATGRPPADPAPESGCELVRAEHLDLLERLLPLPACLLTAKYDILASNAAYRFLFGDLDAEPVAERNCMIRAFLDPRWAEAFVEYDAVTEQMVASLRAEMATHLDDPAWDGLVVAMRARSRRFAELWDRRDLRSRIAGQRLRLAGVGEASVRITRLWLERGSGVHVKIMQPRSDHDAVLLRRHADRALAGGVPPVTARPTITARLARTGRRSAQEPETDAPVISSSSRA